MPVGVAVGVTDVNPGAGDCVFTGNVEFEMMLGIAACDHLFLRTVSVSVVTIRSSG